MAKKRSTREKIRWQSQSAIADLKKASDHYAQMAGIANDRSGTIDKYLPHIQTMLEMMINMAEQFDERL
jgi:hypothetical protein